MISVTVENLMNLNRMLKKASPGLFQPRNRKMRFPGSFIFNGLQPLKMAVYPDTAHRLSKNCVFQRSVNKALIHKWNFPVTLWSQAEAPLHTGKFS